MKGIKNRLVVSHLIVIFLTVIILEIFLIMGIRKYYYKNAQSLLSNQIKVSVDFYENYFSSSSLEKNVQDNADIFWKNTSAEVQIIDTSKKMLMDSIGNFSENKIEDIDVQKALENKIGTLIKKDKYTKENTLYVSYPLKSSNKIEGALRFITPLTEIDKIIKKLSFILISLGFLVILLSSLVSILLSNSIVKPLEKIIKIAKKFASGKFNERLIKEQDDEIGKLSDTLNFMADEIVKNENLKNEFIASVSHELRTPLTSIKGWATTIRFSPLENKEEIVEGLKIIEKESDRLTDLVEELLDFSKFISGKVKLKKDYIDITNIVKFIEKQMKPRAARQNIKFEVQIEEKLPLLFVDKNRINQVLINILDNAFKFTPSKGNININVYKKNNFLFILIKDSGIGIPKEDLPKVTEKFFKGKSNMSKNGIGLSICKEIMDLHKGELKILSKYNKGTSVYLKFPIDA